MHPQTRSSSDLREMLEALDLCYFAGQLEELGVDVRWMPARIRPGARVGQYWHDTKKIEVARPLASLEVPDFYVQGVIHHEAVHAILGPSHDKHSQIFRIMEGRFLYLAQVAEWERETHFRPWPTAPKGLR